MHPRHLVLARHPQARAARREPVYAFGPRGPYLQERWVVRAGSLPLGRGATEDAAWHDAAGSLRGRATLSRTA